MTSHTSQPSAFRLPPSIVVTGAAGFIGRRVVARLMEQGARVFAVDRIPASAVALPGADYQCAELGQNVPAFPEESILVHLAWEMNRSDALAQAHAVTDFARLLDAVSQRGCRGVVGMGSAEEYGELEGCLTEDMAPGTELSAYGQAKQEACRALEAWTQVPGHRAVWLRPFIVYGPGQKGNMVIPYAVRCARERQPADFSAGLQYRDFVHVDDVADGIARAALHVEGAGGPFAMCNLGGGRPVQVRTVLERVARQLDAEDLFHFGVRPMREGEPKEQFASIDSAGKVLGWSARISWEEGIDALCKEPKR